MPNRFNLHITPSEYKMIQISSNKSIKMLNEEHIDLINKNWRLIDIFSLDNETFLVLGK